MVIVYGCVENQKTSTESLTSTYLTLGQKMLNLNDYFNMLENTFHIISIKYLKSDDFQIENDDELFEQFINGSIQNWPFKLCEYYFEYFYFNELVVNDHEGFSQTNNRLNLLKMLKFNLFKTLNNKNVEKDNTKAQIEKFCTIKNLCFLIKAYEAAITRLLKTIEENFCQENKILPITTSMELYHSLNENFNEVKLLVRCLSDILTSGENESFSKTNLDFVQKQENILSYSCQLFQHIHINDNLNKFIRESTQKVHLSASNCIETKQQKANYNTNPYFNLKCEFVRLIGILVYNNGFNQNLLTNYKVLHLISSNLNIDFDNPFIREWSLVALKHILSCLDLKQ